MFSLFIHQKSKEKLLYVYGIYRFNYFSSYCSSICDSWTLYGSVGANSKKRYTAFSWNNRAQKMRIISRDLNWRWKSSLCSSKEVSRCKYMGDRDNASLFYTCVFQENSMKAKKLFFATRKCLSERFLKLWCDICVLNAR